MATELQNLNQGTEIYSAPEMDGKISGQRTAVGTAAGTNTYTLTLTPALTAYALGQVFDVLFTNACTATATLNINGLGAKAIKRNGLLATKAKDILGGQVLSLMYDGTDFQIVGRVSTTGGWQRSFYPYNMLSATGGWSWNGTILDGGPGSATLFNRYLFSAFGGANGNQEGEYVNTTLPDNYLAGEDIKITIINTSNATGNYIFNVGVTQPTAGNVFGGIAETEWIANTIAGSLGFTIISTDFIFDGTNMEPGDPLAILIYRNGGAASDTMISDAYLNGILIQQA